MRAWWSGLEARERQTLAAGAVVLVALLVYGVVWMPLDGARERLLERRAAQVEDLRWMQRAAQEIDALRRGGAQAERSGGRRSLLAQVDISSKAAGIAPSIANIQPEGEQRVVVLLEEVNFDALVRWLGWLRARGAEATGLSLERVARGADVRGRIVLVGEE